MYLDLTEDERNHVRVKYNAIRFEVDFGRSGTMLREYFSADAMMREFEENGIEKADFDEEALRIFQQERKKMQE